MTLLEKIDKDFKEALRAKDEIKVSTLRMLKSQIKNKEIALRNTPQNLEKKELSDEIIMDVISRQIKQRNDSIKEFKSGGRDDLVKKEQQELNILKAYLPEEMSGKKITKIIDEVIKSTGAQSMADMRKVMPEVITQTKGRADNSKIAQLVKSRLEK